MVSFSVSYHSINSQRVNNYDRLVPGVANADAHSQNHCICKVGVGTNDSKSNYSPYHRIHHYRRLFGHSGCEMYSTTTIIGRARQQAGSTDRAEEFEGMETGPEKENSSIFHRRPSVNVTYDEDSESDEVFVESPSPERVDDEIVIPGNDIFRQLVSVWFESDSDKDDDDDDSDTGDEPESPNVVCRKDHLIPGVNLDLDDEFIGYYGSDDEDGDDHPMGRWIETSDSITLVQEETAPAEATAVTTAIKRELPDRNTASLVDGASKLCQSERRVRRRLNALMAADGRKYRHAGAGNAKVVVKSTPELPTTAFAFLETSESKRQAIPGYNNDSIGATTDVSNEFFDGNEHFFNLESSEFYSEDLVVEWENNQNGNAIYGGEDTKRTAEAGIIKNYDYSRQSTDALLSSDGADPLPQTGGTITTSEEMDSESIDTENNEHSCVNQKATKNRKRDQSDAFSQIQLNFCKRIKYLT